MTGSRKKRKEVAAQDEAIEKNSNVGGKWVTRSSNDKAPIVSGGRIRSTPGRCVSGIDGEILPPKLFKVEKIPKKGRLNSYSKPEYLQMISDAEVCSVTKAYQVYKKHLESSMNDQLNSTTGSGFGLLPEEDLHLLARKYLKKRCDRGKQRPKSKDRDPTGNMISTKGIGKHTLRRKICLQKKQRSCGSHNIERISVSVRNVKREEKYNRKRCAPSARSSLEDADSKEDGYILFEGKRTMLGWMIDSAIVPLKGKVQCVDCKKTNVFLEGVITKEGIQCNCCDKLFSGLDFEVHAGGMKSQPFKKYCYRGFLRNGCVFDKKTSYCVNPYIEDL